MRPAGLTRSGWRRAICADPRRQATERPQHRTRSCPGARVRPPDLHRSSATQREARDSPAIELLDRQPRSQKLGQRVDLPSRATSRRQAKSTRFVGEEHAAPSGVLALIGVSPPLGIGAMRPGEIPHSLTARLGKCLEELVVDRGDSIEHPREHGALEASLGVPVGTLQCRADRRGLHDLCWDLEKRLAHGVYHGSSE